MWHLIVEDIGQFFPVSDLPLVACLPKLVLSKSNLIALAGEDVDTGIGLCGWLLTAISWVIVIFTLPFSLCVCFKVLMKTIYIY